MSQDQFPYEKYEKLVHALAWKYSRAYNVDYDDLVGCGHIGYMKALKSFDESRGCKFSTHLVHKIKGEIRKTLQPRAGTLAEDMKAELDERLPDNNSHMERRLQFIEALQGMGKEAQEVVEIILESPAELFDWTAGVVKITIKNLREYLRYNGWSNRAINSAFNEIKNTLRAEL